MPRSLVRYIVFETLVSMLANAVLVAAIGVALFGNRARIGVWAMGGVEFDLLLQTSTVAFLSSLVPCLLTRRRLARGALAGGDTAFANIRTGLLTRSLLIALTAIVIVIPVVSGSLALLSPASLSFASLLELKVILAIATGGFATSLSLRRALGVCDPA